jgi:signal transduction histidine kinase
MFEINAPGIGSTTDLDGLRGRVEALGGRLTITSSRQGMAVVACSLPIER